MQHFCCIILFAAILVPVSLARGQDSYTYISSADFLLTLNGLDLDATVLTDEDAISLITNYSVDENGTMHFAGRFEGETEAFIERTVEVSVAGGWVTRVEQGPAASATPFNGDFLSDGVDMISMQKCECDDAVGGQICSAPDCQHTHDCTTGGSGEDYCHFIKATTGIEDIEIFGNVF